MPSVRRGHGAGARRNSCPDRMAAGGRLPRSGAMGLSDGSVVCGNGGVPRCPVFFRRSRRRPRSHYTLPGTTGCPAAHSRELSEDSTGMRPFESDANEFDHYPSAHPQREHIIDRGNSRFDCPMDDVEDLWQSWGQPDMWRLPHGHFAVCCGIVPGLPGRVMRWLSPRLNAPTAQVRPTEAAGTQVNARA